jgi:hypothetical protein
MVPYTLLNIHQPVSDSQFHGGKGMPRFHEMERRKRRHSRKGQKNTLQSLEPCKIKLKMRQS